MALRVRARLIQFTAELRSHSNPAIIALRGTMSDVIDVQHCPLCHQPLDVNSSDTIDYNGQLVHGSCVTAAEAPKPPGYNPNNSYT
jgi:hypothetical protein